MVAATAKKSDLDLSKAEVEKKVQEYKAKLETRFNKRLDARVERYEADLKDKASAQYEIIVRRAKLDELRARMKEIKETVGTLKSEIKELKAAGRKSKKGASADSKAAAG